MPDDVFQNEVDRFRSSGLLGRPGSLSALFEFLVTRTLSDQPPKEIEIALEVFGKNSDFAAGEDAVVRVYIHRLRRKLEEFY